MPAYETEELKWGVDIVSYSLDAKGAAIDALNPRKNWFEDSRGKGVAGFDFGGRAGQWGRFYTPLGGNAAVNPVPKIMHLQYYDSQEGKAYRLDTALPQQQIYDLLKKPRIDFVGTGVGDIRYYDTIGIGFAPKGHIFLYVGGALGNLEIAHYQAKEIPNFNIEQYNSTVVEGLRLNRMESLKFYLTPETVEKIRKGWTPSPDVYLHNRIKYPWRWSVSENVQLVDTMVQHANLDRGVVFARELAQEQSKLKSVPRRIDLYFNDRATGQRYDLEITYIKERVLGEPDFSEVTDALDKLFSNRKVEDNQQTVPDSEFANIHVDISADIKHASFSIRKGDVNIPLHTLKYTITPMAPYSFDTGGDVMPSPEQLKHILQGPTAQILPTVKVGGVCPKTGFWQCPQLAHNSTIFMRQGDIMPGQSYKLEGMNVGEMYWEWVKEG